MTSINVPDPVMSLAIAPKARDSNANFSKALNRCGARCYLMTTLLGIFSLARHAQSKRRLDGSSAQSCMSHLRAVTL